MKSTLKRRTFTAEFKRQAIELALLNGDVLQTARDLGIDQSNLRKWIMLAQGFFKTPKSGEIRNFLIKIEANKPLKAESVDELIFQMGIAETKQGLQENSFEHPQGIFTGTTALVGIGLINNRNFPHQRLPINDPVQFHQMFGKFTGFSRLERNPSPKLS